MPLWTLDELQHANAQLKLGIERESIDERFQFVGGTARYCLCVIESDYQSNKSTIISEIAELESYAKLLDCLKNTSNANGVSDSLFHMIAKPNLEELPRLYDLSFCSEKIRSLIDRAVVVKDKDKRMELTRWLRGNSECGRLGVQFVESRFKETATRGCTVTLQSFTGNESVELGMVAHKYRTSPTTNFPDVDGSYFDEITGFFYFFQCTVSDTHPVNAMRIILSCEALVKEDANAVDFSKLRLVFVVPKSNNLDQRQAVSYRYGRQLSPFDSVKEINGLGTNSAEKLAKLNVRTISELQAFIATNPVDAAREKFIFDLRRLLSEYEADIKLELKYPGLENIPLFKVEMD
jgi:hypothetical protein